MHRYFKHLKSSMTFFRYATTSLYIIVHLDTRKSLQLFLFGSVKNATKFEQKKLLRKRFPLKEKGEETTTIQTWKMHDHHQKSYKPKLTHSHLIHCICNTFVKMDWLMSSRNNL